MKTGFFSHFMNHNKNTFTTFLMLNWALLLISVTFELRKSGQTESVIYFCWIYLVVIDRSRTTSYIAIEYSSTSFDRYIFIHSTHFYSQFPLFFSSKSHADIKFIYSEKATKFYKISTLLLSYVVPVKSKLEILQNFVAFSEYINFNSHEIQEPWLVLWQVPKCMQKLKLGSVIISLSISLPTVQCSSM